jgi:hypothetical protein
MMCSPRKEVAWRRERCWIMATWMKKRRRCRMWWWVGLIKVVGALVGVSARQHLLAVDLGRVVQRLMAEVSVRKGVRLLRQQEQQLR